MTERIDQINRVQGDGATETFTRVKGVHEDLELIDPLKRYFAYNLAHVAVPPVSSKGARVRVLRGFATREEAVEFATEVHEHDGSTVLVGELHSWFVCCNSIDGLRDGGRQVAKRDGLLTFFDRVRAQADRESARFHALQKRVGVNVHQWVKEVALAPEVSAPLLKWADANSFTHERCGALTDDEGDELGIDAGVVRAAHAAWMLLCESEIDSEAAAADEDDPQPEEAVDEAELAPTRPEPPATPTKKSRRFDASLEAKAQQVAVVTVVHDVTTEAHAEPLVRVLGLFESTEMADAYVRNVAGNVERKHNMFVVDMYKWIDLTHDSAVKLQHRDDELQNIMQWHEAQPSRIATLEREHGERTGAPRALNDVPASEVVGRMLE